MMPEPLTFQPSTRRRVVVLLIASLVAYGLALVGIGLAVGFDHAASRWLFAAVFLLIAVGFAASVLMRLFLFVFDAKVRTWWWNQAGLVDRALRVTSLAVRTGTVFLL